MKIAIYCRKSVFTGKGESVGNQIDMCKSYIDSKFKDAEIEIYKDEGFSAKNMERPQFKRLLEDVRRGAVEAVVCYRLDRVSRSVSDFASLTEEFIKRGVSFISVKEEFDTGTPMGKAMMYIASVFAQLERETIAERVKDNMRALSQTGRWLGGTAPTGYKSEKCISEADGKKQTFFRLSEVPEESRTVRLIFSLFLNLKSVTAVRRFLLKNGVKTRFCKDFSETAIKGILKNPVYAACDGDTYKYFSMRGAEVTFDENDFGKAIMPYGRRNGKSSVSDIKNWTVAAGAHTPFIPGKEYVTAQEILTGGKAENKRLSSNNYALLSGLLYCKCGRKMRPKKRSNSGELFDYICCGKLYFGTKCCDVPNLGGTFADKSAFGAAMEENPVTEKYFKETEKLKCGIKNSGLKEIKKEIKNKTRKIENLITALADGGFLGETVKDEINRLEKEREELKRKIEKNAAKGFGNALKENIPSVEDMRAYLENYMQKAVWDGEELHIFLYEKR